MGLQRPIVRLIFSEAGLLGGLVEPVPPKIAPLSWPFHRRATPHTPPPTPRAQASYILHRLRRCLTHRLCLRHLVLQLHLHRCVQQRRHHVLLLPLRRGGLHHHRVLHNRLFVLRRLHPDKITPKRLVQELVRELLPSRDEPHWAVSRKQSRTAGSSIERNAHSLV